MSTIASRKLAPHLNGEKITLIDIGARYGIHKRWDAIASLLNVYAFEPDAEECARINASAESLPYRLECIPCALGDSAQSGIPLYICKDPGCSSLYQPNLEFARQFYFGDSMEVTRTVQVSTERLDTICNQRNLRPDVIKIDTQGYELNILKGSGSVLDTVKFVELEVEFNEQYKDQPLFSDVDLFMRSRGFALLGLRRTYWRRQVTRADLRSPFGGQIVHGDVLYYNDKLLKDPAGYATREDLIKYCAVLSVYSQDDFVVHLLTAPHPALRTIPEGERLALAAALLTRTSGLSALMSRLLDLVRKRFWLPHTSLRGTIDRLQSKVARDWHDPDIY